MSLLDDVSIVVTPNGYKAGTLYGVLPTYAEGSDLVDNGDFATDTDWSKSSQSTISNGSARILSTDGSYQYIAQSNSNYVASQGKIVKVTLDITNYVSGTLKAQFSGGTGYNFPQSEGTHTLYFLNDGTTGTFNVARVAGVTDITIDNVSVKEVTSSDMDVTRATAATRVDENGLVNYAEIIGGEEVTNGDFATDSDWSVTQSGNDTITIENGYALFNCPDNSNIYISQGGLLTIGKTYIASVDLLSIDSGSLQFAQGGGGTITGSPSINTLGTHTFTFIAATATFAVKRKLGAPNLLNAKIDNVSVKEITRDNVPRIDYTGGGCPHILSEPQRTNLITYSSDFSQSYWTKQSNITPTYNTTETLSPDGTYNATKLVGNGTDGIYKASISITGVAARSVYLKSVTGTVNVILKDPNLTVTSPTLDVTTEWQRFELTEDNGSSGQGIWVDDIPASGIYIWGAQVEESYPTSYIPTSGSTVTRNQDIFTRDGIGSLINDSEGTLYFEGSALENGGGIHRIISLSDGSYDNLIYIRIDSTASRFRGFSRGSSGSYTIITVNSIPQTDNNKIALVWDATNFRIWINGSERATATINNLPVGMNTLNLADPTSSGNFFGKVKQLQVYKTALTDAQLTSLTS